jgi:uncharacterized protein (UPF0333 family)
LQGAENLYKQDFPNIYKITMERKAQAAMEYLMTYGWAILIVIIVAAALYALGVFDPSTWTGDRATGFSNMGAPASGAWKLSAANASDQFQLQLTNNLPSRINITAISVSIGTTSCPNIAGTGTVGIGGSITVNAYCGAQTANSPYTADVTLTYNNLDTGITGLKESGKVTGSVV